MDFLSKRYSVLRGGDKSSGQAPHPNADDIDKICDRILHSNLLEDRRNAVNNLRGLAKLFKIVGSSRIRSMKSLLVDGLAVGDGEEGTFRSGACLGA